jgi:cytochrome c553
MIKIVTKIVSLVAFCSLLYALPLEATVTGACSNCHTMHSSQSPAPQEWKEKGWVPGIANPALLVASCIGCHSSTTEAGTILYGNTPIVFNTLPPNAPLAGGNFYYMTSDDAKGHNVAGINSRDATLGFTPPGAPVGTSWSEELRCAGTYGCHGHNGRQGDPPVPDETQAIMGAHHGNDTPPLEGSLTDVARNYRFLLGIKGKEDADWEQYKTDTSHHNEYKGSTTSATDTISYFCAECHGNFHTWVGGSSEVGTASPWLRHPTDIALKSTGEYSSYTAYSMVAPVARPNPDSVLDPTKVTDTDIIMCLSCHRAHASPYFKMMRWTYKCWPECNTECTEGYPCTNGCNVCHTWKD